jgi:hypothetical protein
MIGAVLRHPQSVVRALVAAPPQAGPQPGVMSGQGVLNQAMLHAAFEGGFVRGKVQSSLHLDLKTQQQHSVNASKRIHKNKTNSMMKTKMLLFGDDGSLMHRLWGRVPDRFSQTL